MAHRLGELTIEEAAERAAGNWQDFECFVWFRRNEIEDPENWAIIYTHHRDSGLLSLSNASVFQTALERFTDGDDPSVVFETHSSWLVGHIDGFSIRVFRDGKITDAFRKYHELAESESNYCILDEEDFSRREYEATLENIGEAAWRLKRGFDLPDEWETDVYDWLWQNRDHAVECVGDNGAWPEEDDLRAAFDALGYPQVEAACG